MATFEMLQYFKLALLKEAKREIGDKLTPVEVTISGQVWDSSNVTIADNFGAKTLWSTTNGGLTSFDYLLFMSNQDVFLELVNTTPNPDERALVFCLANVIYVLPGIMGGYASNTSRLDGADMILDTDFAPIKEINVQRDVADAVGDATVRLVLID